jgi:hypothetical protein
VIAAIGTGVGVAIRPVAARSLQSILTVVSEKASPPPEKSQVGVKGVFQALVTLGSRSLAILREESRFNP